VGAATVHYNMARIPCNVHARPFHAWRQRGRRSGLMAVARRLCLGAWREPLGSNSLLDLVVSAGEAARHCARVVRRIRRTALQSRRRRRGACPLGQAASCQGSRRTADVRWTCSAS